MVGYISNATLPVSSDGIMLQNFSSRACMYKNPQDVPDYVSKANPFFLGFIALEFVIAVVKGLPTLRVNDGINSLSAGLLSQLIKFVVINVEVELYLLIYENYRLTTLPWDSAWTWWLCFFAVDLGYYFFHRAAHEVNIFWAAHQVHHSSEDYNLTTSFRQGVGQSFFSPFFYLPIAFAVPPSVCFIHLQLNVLYQFWIHTEVIKSLGPLEYIFNTPTHHRVHHGRNPFCIDKNYGGILIIWDRLFGTFQEETDEEIAFGITVPLETWDPLWNQIQHYVGLCKTSWDMSGLWNKVSVFVKGPSWSPGKPRLGNGEYAEIEFPIRKYTSGMSVWGNIYVVCHFAFALLVFHELSARHLSLSQLHVSLVALFFIMTITVFGTLMDNKSHGPFLEFARCIICVGVEFAATNNGINIEVVPSFLPTMFLRIFYLGSAYIWFLVALIDRKLEASKMD